MDTIFSIWKLCCAGRAFKWRGYDILLNNVGSDTISDSKLLGSPRQDQLQHVCPDTFGDAQRQRCQGMIWMARAPGQVLHSWYPQWPVCPHGQMQVHLSLEGLLPWTVRFGDIIPCSKHMLIIKNKFWPEFGIETLEPLSFTSSGTWCFHILGLHVLNGCLHFELWCTKPKAIEEDKEEFSIPPCFVFCTRSICFSYVTGCDFQKDTSVFGSEMS